MLKVVAINGSPNQAKGYTAMILKPFLEGLESDGADIHLYSASQLKVKPCSCGHLYCWNRSPGECIFQDSMQKIYPLLKQAEILVLATPVYIPLPGDMQNFINRLTPLLNPNIEYREGRTRAQFREDVQIKKIVLVASGGWWEAENFDTVVRIVKELAAVAGLDYSGSVIRPHVQYMKIDGEISEEGQEILCLVKQAAKELIQLGKIKEETLKSICRPLISKEEFLQNWS